MRIPRVLAGALSLLTVFAASAQADVATSTNWAGYAVHRHGVRFRSVSGTWIEPSASCVAGYATYSAMWIGLGGYAASSPALEQIGTETDCTAHGRVVTGAWYEMVPAASRDLPLTVRPGDVMSASVSVSGRTATLKLSDQTRHRSVTRRVHGSVVDIYSAEWILEAPSECTASGACQTLPLADFGQAAFVGARARSIAGHTGTIADGSWGATRIRLLTGGGGRRQFAVYQGIGSGVGTATPSPLVSSGGGFSLAFAAASRNGPGGPPSAATARVPGTHIVHPLR